MRSYLYGSHYDASTSYFLDEYFYYYFVNKYSASPPAVSSVGEEMETAIPNQPPEFSNLSPADGETDVELDTLLITLNISDPEGDTFSYEWACSDGSYNSAVGNTNGTKGFMLDASFPALDCGTTYTWWVNASDAEGYTNESYTFTTVDCAVAGDDTTPPSGTIICPTCFECEATCLSVDASIEGGNTNVSFYSNYTGSWLLLKSYSNVSGTVYAVMDIAYNTTYYWYVNVSEYENEGNYVNSSIMNFTTASSASICGSGSTVGTAHFSMLFSLFMFLILFLIGYFINTRSAGFLLAISGFVLLHLEAAMLLYVSGLVMAFYIPISVLIIILGFKKLLYPPKEKTSRSED